MRKVAVRTPVSFAVGCREEAVQKANPVFPRLALTQVQILIQLAGSDGIALIVEGASSVFLGFRGLSVSQPFQSATSKASLIKLVHPLSRTINNNEKRQRPFCTIYVICLKVKGCLGHDGPHIGSEAVPGRHHTPMHLQLCCIEKPNQIGRLLKIRMGLYQRYQTLQDSPRSHSPNCYRPVTGLKRRIDDQYSTRARERLVQEAK